MRDINLDGGEVTIIKALGIGGSEVSGAALIDQLPMFEETELAEMLKGLIAVGYVNCDKAALRSDDEFREARFQVNSGYAKELREALDPQPKKVSRRVRRE